MDLTKGISMNCWCKPSNMCDRCKAEEERLLRVRKLSLDISKHNEESNLAKKVRELENRLAELERIISLAG